MSGSDYLGLSPGNFPLASPEFTGNPTAPTAGQFDNDTSIANTAFVQRALGGYAGSVSLGASRTLTSSDIGKVVWVNINAAVATIPTPSSLGATVGSSFTLFTVDLTASVVPGAGAIINHNISAVSSLSLKSGQSVTLVALSTSTWQVIGSGAELGRNADFQSSTSGASGYQKLPSGLIIQWGPAVTSASGDVTFTFPITFPTSVRSVVVAPNLVSGGSFVGYNTVALASVAVNGWLGTAANTRAAISCNIIAIGH